MVDNKYYLKTHKNIIKAKLQHSGLVPHCPCTPHKIEAGPRSRYPATQETDMKVWVKLVCREPTELFITGGSWQDTETNKETSDYKTFSTYMNNQRHNTNPLNDLFLIYVYSFA